MAHDPQPSSASKTHATNPAADAATRDSEVVSTTLDDSSFQAALGNLLEEIGTLPATERAKLRDAAATTRERHEQLKGTIVKLQETLDFLRMSVKYLVFDLEATRRENQYLRRMLDEATGND